MRISTAHQIFYDETGIEISLSVDRALKNIIKQLRQQDMEELIKKFEKETEGEAYTEYLIKAIKDYYQKGG